MTRGYTSGAKLVIHALQGIEKEEVIWIGNALIALSDLSQIDSILARALRTAWNESMRMQFRAGLSGRPGTELQRLNMPTEYGFRVQNLISEADQIATKEGAQEISERHIAAALVKSSPTALGSFGIDGGQLIAEVTGLEMGPQEERIQRGVELERLRFGRAREEVYRDAFSEVEKSGEVIDPTLIMRIPETILRAMVAKRIEIRKDVRL